MKNKNLLFVIITLVIILNPVFIEQTVAQESSDAPLISVIIELENGTTLDSYINRSRSRAYKNLQLNEFLETNEAISLAKEILTEQEQIQKIITEIDSEAKFSYSYTSIINGFAAAVSPDKLSQISNIEGVMAIYADMLNEPHALINEPDLRTWGYDNSYAAAADSRGYRGKNMTIAVIDSGINYNHTALQTNIGYTDSEISKIKTEFSQRVTDNASTLSAKKISDNKGYINQKIPFGYDYSGDTSAASSVLVAPDPDPIDATGHGTHVSGIIAAAKNDTMKSIAPDSMILAMKVFPNAYDSIVLAAIDDSIKLGANFINISAGSAAGFTGDRSSSINYESKFNAARRAGILIVSSAGNNYRLGVYNSGMYSKTSPSQYSYPYTTNPDIGMIGSPSTSLGSVSAAAYGESISNGVDSDKTAPLSSIGPAPDLSLKPEISAPGTEIYSTSNVSTNGYVTKSGTSMASPMIAGGLALVREYVKASEIFNNAQDQTLLTEQILISTADLITEGNGHIASPRKQGAGAMNLDKATKASAVVYNTYNGRTKIELGDKLSESSGFQFIIKNYSNQDKTYLLNGNVLTDKHTNAKSVSNTWVIDFTNEPQVILPESTPLSGAKIIFDSGSKVTVAAGATLTVDCTLVIPALHNNFPNGRFIEGFINLTDTTESVSEETVDLVIPFMGFQGDWLSPHFADAGSIYDQLTTNTDSALIPYYKKQNDAVYRNGTAYELLGAKGYIDSIAISPRTSDNICDQIIPRLMLLRNTVGFELHVKDEDDNTIRTIRNTNDRLAAKSYSTLTNQAAPYTLANTGWNGKDNKGNIVPEGSYKIEVYGISDYDSDKNGTKDDKFIKTFSLPVTVDDTPPVLERVYTTVEEGGIYMNACVSDGHYVKNIILPETSSTLLPDEDSMPVKIKLPTIGPTLENITVLLEDYAGNKSKTYYPYRSIDAIKLKNENSHEMPPVTIFKKGEYFKIYALSGESTDDCLADIVWKTSDSTIAEVDEYGIVTGKKGGTATITATLPNNVSASCEISVLESGYDFIIFGAEKSNNKISFSIKNITGKSGEAAVYISLYSNGRLIKTIKKEISSNPLEDILISEQIEGSKYNIKVIVWDKEDYLRPLSKPTVF